MPADYVVKIGNSYRYRRRVPSEVAHLDPRKEIKISLKTKDLKSAQIKASIFNDQMESFWKSLVDSNRPGEFDQKYLAAVQLAKAYGFSYKTSDQVAASALTEITERLSRTGKTLFGESEKAIAEAVLGGVNKPKIPLSKCWELFENLVHARLVDKTKEQIRKWENVRKLALNNFIEVTKAEYLDEVDRSEILAFWNHLNERIKNGYKANSANKQLAFLKDVLRTVAVMDIPEHTLPPFRWKPYH